MDEGDGNMKIRRLVVVSLIALGLWQFGQGIYIEVKAWLAQQLLLQAWSDTRQGEPQVTPWPWADTWPVAKLKVERLGVDQVVLAGASGRTLAFGPGHLFGSAVPGGEGNSIISGHRDTHFRFLKELQLGDHLEVVRSDGRRVQYAVYRRTVRHQDDVSVLNLPDTQLTLITCYPFEALVPGGPERFVVEARPVLM